MYRYRYRAAADGEGMLIEFQDADAACFVADLLFALAPVQARMRLAERPAMDDEYVMDLITTTGTFLFHKDSWGSAFILAPDDSTDLAALDGLLRSAAAFRAGTAE